MRHYSQHVWCQSYILTWSHSYTVWPAHRFFAWVIEGCVPLGSRPPPCQRMLTSVPRRRAFACLYFRWSCICFLDTLCPPPAFVPIGWASLVVREERTLVCAFTAFVLKASTRSSLQIHMGAPDCKNPADSFLYWLCIPKIWRSKKCFRVKREVFGYTSRMWQEWKVTPTLLCSFCPLSLIQFL